MTVCRKTTKTNITKSFESNNIYRTARRLFYLTYAMYFAWNRTGIKWNPREALMIYGRKVMRHQALLKNVIGKIDSRYRKCSKFKKCSNYRKNRLYNMARKADEMCKMISQRMTAMSDNSSSFCALKKYSLTKPEYQH